MITRLSFPSSNDSMIVCCGPLNASNPKFSCNAFRRSCFEPFDLVELADFVLAVVLVPFCRVDFVLVAIFINFPSTLVANSSGCYSSQMTRNFRNCASNPERKCIEEQSTASEIFEGSEVTKKHPVFYRCFVKKMLQPPTGKP